MIKVWYFLRLPASRYKPYRDLVAVSVLSLSLDIVYIVEGLFKIRGANN